MRIAFLSDTHGNYVALKAVLADLKTQGADQVIFLGDAATIGSHPNETLDTLRALDCVCIMGNHDEATLHPERALELQIATTLHASLEWTVERMSRADLDFLASFRAQTYFHQESVDWWLASLHEGETSAVQTALGQAPATLSPGILLNTLYHLLWHNQVEMDWQQPFMRRGVIHPAAAVWLPTGTSQPAKAGTVGEMAS